MKIKYEIEPSDIRGGVIVEPQGTKGVSYLIGSRNDLDGRGTRFVLVSLFNGRIITADYNDTWDHVELTKFLNDLSFKIKE